MMTTEFLFFANLVLLLRLRLLLADGLVGAGRWAGKAIVELLALALFEPHAFLMWAAVAILAFNAIAALAEKRMRDRSGARLLWGMLQLVAFSILFSNAGGVHFRAELADGGNWIASWSTIGAELLRLTTTRGLKMLLGLLLAANEANLLVRWLLGRLQIKPGTIALGDGRIDANEFNRGRVIGLLERVLIYAFVLSGQYGAIGFTLAAKGFTRFKELENRGFAEYVLIGTLLSSSLAMAAGVWVRFAL